MSKTAAFRQSGAGDVSLSRLLDPQRFVAQSNSDRTKGSVSGWVGRDICEAVRGTQFVGDPLVHGENIIGLLWESYAATGNVGKLLHAGTRLLHGIDAGRWRS